MSPKSDKIRVLHVVGKMNRGGAETWLMRILRGIDRERFQMDFLVHVNEECAYDQEIRDLGGRVIACTDYWPWAYDRAIQRAIRTYGPYDIVHSQLYLFSGFIMRSAHRAGVPVRIAHMHPLQDVDSRRPGRNLVRRYCLKWLSEHSTCFIAPSLTTMDTFQAMCDCSKQYSDIVYNCLELEPYQAQLDRAAVRREFHLPANVPVVAYVARFVPHKNHELLFKLADQINNKSIQAHFALAGSHGPLMESLKAQACTRSDVSVLPGISDISRLLLVSDAFVFPSLEEGFGVVAVEAAAAGLPVIATDLPTIREALAPSHQALMFKPNDAKTAANHLLRVLADAPLRDSLSADARNWASKFSVQQSVDKLVSVYENCLSMSSQRAANMSQNAR